MTKNLNPLSLTRNLLNFNTINPPGQEHDCAKYLGKLLEDGGFKTSYHAHANKRTNLVARWEGRSNKAPICFTGHLDTVPLGALDWSRDPFNGELDGNKVYGRGSTDMKSGVAAMVLASLKLAQSSAGEGGIILVLTASEETGCEGAYHLAGLGDVLGTAGAVVVGEPTGNYPCIGHKGILWIEASTQGITAHGSMPEQGENAIYKAAKAVSQLEQFDFQVSPHDLLGMPTLNVGTISGGLNYNSVPDLAKIGIDIRTTPEQNNSDVHENLKSCLGSEVTTRAIVDVESLATSPENEWVQDVYSIMTPYLDEKPEGRGVSFGTDASALTPAFGGPPTVILGPGEPSMLHKTDEYCQISRIEEATDAYLEIAKKWCNL